MNSLTVIEPEELEITKSQISLAQHETWDWYFIRTWGQIAKITYSLNDYCSVSS